MQKDYKEPYDLVVFDHHADLMVSSFQGILSCGNWIRQILEEQKFLKRVILIGVSDELACAVREDFKDRVKIYTESELSGKDWVSDFAGQLKEPVYLSVDKDVFSSSELLTDWDQGSMTLAQLSRHGILSAKRNQFWQLISAGNITASAEETDGLKNRINETAWQMKRS